MTNSGGWEILVAKAGSRKQLVSVSVGSASIPRMNHLTSGLIYIFPLKGYISLEQNRR